MRFKHLFITTGMLVFGVCAVIAQGRKNSYQEIASGKITGISPNGAYAVGCGSGWGDEFTMKSFVYNVNTKETEWKTAYDETDYDKSGQFAAITNSGIIAGAMKNKDMLIEIVGSIYAPKQDGKSKVRKSGEEGEVTYIPITTAAVWKNGKAIKLGTGNHGVEEFSDGTDGSYAAGISDDGNTVVGYIRQSWMPVIPCGWTYDAGKGEYIYKEYAMPKNCTRGSVKGISANGKVAFGEVTYNGNNVPAIWTSPESVMRVPISDEQYDGNSEADAVSSDGKYVLMHGTSYIMSPMLLVYDTETDDMTEIPLPGNTVECRGLTVADNGDAIVTIASSTDYTPYLYYFSMSNKAIADLDTYIRTVAPDIEGMPESLKSQTVTAVSADGCVIGGFDNTAMKSWLLTIESNNNVMINAPKITDLFYCGVNKITVKWNEVTNVTEKATVTAYRVYVDNILKETVDAKTAVNGAFSYTLDVTTGTHRAYVVAVATADGKEIVSPASETMTVSVSPDTSLIFYDNFDDCVIDAFGNPMSSNDNWTALMPLGNEGEIIKWSLESYNYENNTPYMSTVSISGQPWSSVLLSRFLDATDMKDFFLTFYAAYYLTGSDNQDLSSDRLDVEYSTDGEHWTVLESLRAADIQKYAWNFYKTDLGKELAGKVFQIRFNAHGEGKATLKWNVDCIGINNKLEGDAPTGLRAVKNNKGGADLTWHNSIGTYEVSYVENSNILTDYCTGSEGTPLIAAVDMEPEMLAGHTGEYITSVTAFIFDNPAIETTQPTKAEAIVYCGNEAVARGNFEEAFNTPYSSTAALSSPVRIESGKQYRVAVRIYDYDQKQTPLYYQSTTNFKAGKTDLFSEDEGKTWQRMSDVYTTESDIKLGQCVWPIRANITTGPTADSELFLDEELLAYNIYRDGKQVNTVAVFAAHPRFTDNYPTDGAKYTVQAFYKDGRMSPESEAVTVSTTAIDGISGNDKVSVRRNLTTGAVEIDGEFDSAEMFSAGGSLVGTARGNRVSTAGIGAGVYLLRVKVGGLSEVHKIVIGR